MQVSVDISLYPLNADYKTPILRFIEAIEEEPGVEIVRNDLATQVYGEFRTVMNLLSREFEQTLMDDEASIFVIKMVGGNRLGQNT